MSGYVSSSSRRRIAEEVESKLRDQFRGISNDVKQAAEDAQTDTRALEKRVETLEIMIKGIAAVLCDPRSEEAQAFTKVISGSEKPVVPTSMSIKGR